MAFAGPVAIMFLIGIMDTGVAVYSNNILAEAAREGARYAAVHGALSSASVGPAANNAVVQQEVLKYAFGLVPANLTVQSSWPDSDNNPYSRVTVQLAYNYTPVGLFGASFVLRCSSTMVIFH
jgi:Flp pilus assembly protein TadG